MLKLENGMRVKISDKYGSYNGKYYGELGTIERSTGQGKTQGIRLDNFSNNASSYGLFWFQSDEVEIVQKGMRTGVNINIVKARHLEQIGSKVFSWVVPNHISKINIGDILRADTARGQKDVVAISEIMLDDGSNPTKSIILVKKRIENKIPIAFQQEYECKFEKENDKMKEIKTIGILDLWKKNIEDSMISNRKYKLDEIFSKDEIVTTIKEHVEAINKIAVERGYGAFHELSGDFVRQITTETTDDIINQANKEYVEYRENLCKDYTEIKTMLSACDTYEQEMDVLKNYGVVDENCVLVKE